jgi:hypothetical protein
MKRSIHGPWAALFVCALLGMAAPGLHGQSSGAAQQNPPAPAPTGQEAAAPVPKPGRLAIGFRVRSFPVGSFSVMGNNSLMTTTPAAGTRPAYDWNFNTTSQSLRFGFGPAIEVPLGPRTTLTAEFLFNRLRYQKVSNVYWGADDPTTSADERSHLTRTENTKARLWDLPVMVHYRGLRRTGVLSRLYIAVGAAARSASTIRTTTDTTNPDTSTASSAIPAQPSKRTLIGGVVGLGFRFVDDFNIKVTPEVRYTRWTGAMFGSDSTQSPRNQLEIGIGFTH